MTTLIDRIMYNLRNFYVPADEKYIRQIIEAELTAVNGVDKHIKILKSVIENASINMGYEMQLRGVLKYLKSLKQTTVASKCKHCRDFNGDGTKTCTDCLKNVPVENLIIEEQLKDYQPKEVNIKIRIGVGKSDNGDMYIYGDGTKPKEVEKEEK